MLQVAIVEDDAKDSERLAEFLKRYEQERQQQIRCSFFTDGLSFISDYTPSYDIILMDIAMPNMDGMSAARRLRKTDETVCLIFITNMAQYAIAGYEVGALDFLLKPVEYFRFAAKLDKAVQSCALKKDRTLTFRTGDDYIRVRLSEICYIKSEKHYVFLVTKGGEYRVRASMKEMEQQLPGELFVRCDNSHIVNLAYVTRINRDSAQVGDATVPISRPRRKEFVNAFTRYLGELQ
ncbi:MAG: LytTR family DNA-binding domain-containing protein [Clostridiales bacterium]|nr:LytTR family DNA-binding domain-containing protein [Clostridiales bacterium]